MYVCILYIIDIIWEYSMYTWDALQASWSDIQSGFRMIGWRIR